MWLSFIFFSIFGFTCSLTTSFDLRGVINGNRMGSVPLGPSLGVGELDVEGICNKPGMACQNCSVAINCVRLPVGWLKLPLLECPEGSTCNAHLGQCSEQPVPECDAKTQEYKHSCEQVCCTNYAVGIFPDANDCRKFHLCSPPEGLPDGMPADHRTALCPRHYGYNPQTAQCSIPIRNGQCKTKTVPDCTKVGEFGVIPSSDNYYYVCVIKDGVLHPQILVCPHGWHFWDDGYCKPEARPKNKKSVSNKSQLGSEQDTSNSDKDNSKSNKSESHSTESNEKNSEEATPKTKETRTTEEPTTYRIDSFFSTVKATTYPADTFLADKFDLTNYESTDDVVQNNDFINSYENNDW